MPRVTRILRSRQAVALISTGTILFSSLLVAAPARAEDIRPVDEASEAVIAEEAAAIESGVTPTGSPLPGPADPGGPVFGCPDAGTHYRVFNKKDLHIPVGIDFKSGPGGSTKASIQNSLSTGVKVSAGVSFSAGALVAKAETTFGIESSVTASIAHTFEYSHNISSNKYGHLRFGNWGWRMGAEKYTVDRTCRVKNKVTGTVTAMPSASTWGYRYWETSS